MHRYAFYALGTVEMSTVVYVMHIRQHQQE